MYMYNRSVEKPSFNQQQLRSRSSGTYYWVEHSQSSIKVIFVYTCMLYHFFSCFNDWDVYLTMDNW